MAGVYSSGSQISSNPSEYTDPAYDDYINSVLTDYGIRFSPGGSGIEEIEDDTSLVPSSEESREATEDKPLNLKIEVLESGQRPSAHHIAASRNFKVSEIGSDEDVGLTIDEARSPSALVTAPAPPTSPPEPPHKKLKVYQREQPFDDPELERRRVNAILAKKNRDLKKKQIRDLEEKVEKLRRVNIQCNKALRRTNKDVQQLRMELQGSTTAKRNLEERLVSKENSIREQREKLMLFREHLDLITSSLDDDNPAKKLVYALLKRLPSDTSLAAAAAAAAGTASAAVTVSAGGTTSNADSTASATAASTNVIVRQRDS